MPFFTSKTPTEKRNNSQRKRRNALYGFFVKLDVKMEIQHIFNDILAPRFCKNIDGEIRIH